MIVEGSGEGGALDYAVGSWSINSSAEDEDSSCLGANDEMLPVDGSFDSAGLIWPFEVAFDGGAVLLEIEILRRGCAVGIVAVEGPFARYVCRKLL